MGALVNSQRTPSGHSGGQSISAHGAEVVANPQDDLYQELKPLLRSPRIERDGTITSFCPIHEGDGSHKRRSLALHPTKGLTCWAGCDFKAILDELRGGQPRPTTRPAHGERQGQREPWKPLGAPAAVYAYKDEHGHTVAEKARFETGGSKTFRFRVPPHEEWGSLSPLREADLPLYGAELVATSSSDVPVYYVEGEKAANACRAQGMIVVTHVGGADQDDFGSAHSILTGRIVRLWADNDEAGRRCMSRTAAKLRGLARQTFFVNVPLPMKEKGDAFDFFAAGGTVESLEAGQLEKPVTEYLAFDGVRVRLPTDKGIVTFTFTEIEKIGRGFEAELEIQMQGAGAEPYTQRINLLSSSAQESLRRSLDAMFGKETGWTSIVNTAIARARQAYLGRELAQRADEIPDPGEQEFLVDTILPKGAATALYADGASGKTFLALRLMIAVALGDDFAGFAARKGAVLFIDYETDNLTWRRRMRRLYQGLGYDDVLPAPHYYWPGRGIPICDQIERIRLFVEKEGVALVIIDSAAAACGGKPEEAEVALRYFSALAKLGPVSTLTIAHVPKGGNTDKPFGSAFWSNQPRRTWFVDAPEEEDAPVKSVALTCRKVNDGPRPRPFGIRITFDGDNGPVFIDQCDVNQIPEIQAKRPIKNRIWDVLVNPMPVHEIAEALGMSEKVDSVASTLRQHRGTLFASVPGGVTGGKGNVAVWARASRMVRNDVT